MKARLLRKILNNTGYTVNNNRDYIAVGSPLCHDLISVNKKNLKLKYALDTWKEGRKCLEKKSSKENPCELLFIYDKLQELIDNGQIQDIIDGNDEVDNPLPVFAIDNGILIEKFTDAYGYPNTTIDGFLMYDNEYFKTKEEAIKSGLKECKSWIKMLSERKLELEAEIQTKVNKINHFKKCLSVLSGLVK
jgi:hypothetical protein